MVTLAVTEAHTDSGRGTVAPASCLGINATLRAHVSHAAEPHPIFGYHSVEKGRKMNIFNQTDPKPGALAVKWVAVPQVFILVE